MQFNDMTTEGMSLIEKLQLLLCLGQITLTTTAANSYQRARDLDYALVRRMGEGAFTLLCSFGLLGIMGAQMCLTKVEHMKDKVFPHSEENIYNSSSNPNNSLGGGSTSMIAKSISIEPKTIGSASKKITEIKTESEPCLNRDYDYSLESMSYRF